MKKIYFTPGPSQLYPTYYKHAAWAEGHQLGSISHRGRQSQDVFKQTATALRQLLNIPPSFHIFFTNSSLESMERILQNCVKKTSLHFVNGAFSRRFYQMALELKKKPKKITAADGVGFVYDKLPKSLSAELICLTQNETSTGVALPMADIYRLRRQYPQALVALDIVSSAPYVAVDFNQIDIAFFSVQKGFGLPAGLAVLIASSRAISKSSLLKKQGYNIGSYHSFASFYEKERKSQTPETPNIVAIYLLGKIVQDMLKKGIKKIRQETDAKARMVYDFFDRHPRFVPCVQKKRWRSATTIAIEVGENKKILKKLSKHGFIVGCGYGKYKENCIRIANFPAHRPQDLKRLLSIFSI